MSELIPCPFCGANNWQYQAYYSGTTVYQCGGCGTICNWSDIVEEAE